MHCDIRSCTYAPGETTIDLPLGRVYIVNGELRASVAISPDEGPGTGRLW